MLERAVRRERRALLVGRARWVRLGPLVLPERLERRVRKAILDLKEAQEQLEQ